MKNIEYTCETRIIPGREGTPVKAIRLNNTETLVHHVTQGKEYGPISYTDHFMTGPIADKLYAYENLGYSPEELKKIVDEHRRKLAWSYAVNSVYGITSPTITKEAVESFIKEEREKAMIADRKRAMEAYIKFDISQTMSMVEHLKDTIKNAKAKLGHEFYMKIKKVIFNDPATIVFWADGTKTVVKATNEKFDPEKGLAMAISKRAFGNNHGYYDVFKKHLKKWTKENPDAAQ